MHLSGHTRCPICDERLKKDWIFCSGCGESLLGKPSKESMGKVSAIPVEHATEKSEGRPGINTRVQNEMASRFTCPGCGARAEGGIPRHRVFFCVTCKSFVHSKCMRRGWNNYCPFCNTVLR